MLSSFNKTFYALVDGPDFSFGDKNFLKNTFDIDFEYRVVNEVERNIEGQLVALKPREKFVINLSGKGSLCECFVGKEFLFVSSALRRAYNEVGKRKIMFEYVFEGANIPFQNMQGNIDQLDSVDGMFCVPLINVYITEKIVSMKNKTPEWELVLEEI